MLFRSDHGVIDAVQSAPFGAVVVLLSEPLQLALGVCAVSAPDRPDRSEDPARLGIRRVLDRAGIVPRIKGQTNSDPQPSMCFLTPDPGRLVSPSLTPMRSRGTGGRIPSRKGLGGRFNELITRQPIASPLC